jgi:phospholipid/cholesterol/gamma-HCH transport system ATP-binding protein
VSEAILELKGVFKAFGPTPLLEGLDLQVFSGETLVVMGTSGSGKSVCLKMLVGLEEPDEGHARFEGRDIAEMNSKELLDLRRRVALVFQRDALFDSMTVLENVAFGLMEHTGMTDAEIRARVVECLDMVDLGASVLDKMPAELSGGMRKRVALARAIAPRPETILFDDPTEGLDPRSITRIRIMIDQLRKTLGTTTVLATHNMPTAFALADRMALLHNRRFAHIGTPAQFRASTSPEVRAFVYGPAGVDGEVFRGEH